MLNNKMLFIFGFFLCYFVQNVFARFDITVKNETNVEFRAIDIILQPVDFGGNIGQTTIENILPKETRMLSFPCVYATVPFIGDGAISLDIANLDVAVIVSPESGSLKVRNQTFYSVLRNVKPIIADDVSSNPDASGLHGIQPPDIKITLTTDVKSYINAEFFPHIQS